MAYDKADEVIYELFGLFGLFGRTLVLIQFNCCVTNVTNKNLNNGGTL